MTTNWTDPRNGRRWVVHVTARRSHHQERQVAFWSTEDIRAARLSGNRRLSDLNDLELCRLLDSAF